MLARYLLHRLAGAVVGLFGVTLITFLLVHASAGGFVPGLQLNPALTARDVAHLKQLLGLDRPLYAQYWSWLHGLAHGDFGRSLLSGTPVTHLILARLPNTILLSTSAMAIAALVSVPMGIAAARRRGTATDQLLTGLSVLGASVPVFWLGLLAILLFSVQFGAWGLPTLPSGGAESALGGGGPLDRLQHLLLPVLVLSFAYISIWMRFIRSSMIDTLFEDYIRTARAKGLPERTVLYRHALRNSLIPFITLLGLELPAIVGGTAIVEIVFSWPGIGRLALDSALQYDYTTILGITTFVAMMVVLGNLLADCLYAFIDPRIRVG